MLLQHLICIDPGNIKSAYVLINKDLKPIDSNILDNDILLELLKSLYVKHLAIEMVASYGMPVGETVFETVFWIGRFWEGANALNKKKIYRKDVKMNLCHTMKAKECNVNQALVDRFASGVSNHGKGNKKEKGWFYKFKSHIWSAYATGVTYSDLYLDD